MLAKQNNALKAEKHSIIRMSMSPAVARSSSLAPGRCPLPATHPPTQTPSCNVRVEMQETLDRMSHNALFTGMLVVFCGGGGGWEWEWEWEWGGGFRSESATICTQSCLVCFRGVFGFRGA